MDDRPEYSDATRSFPSVADMMAAHVSERMVEQERQRRARSERFAVGVAALLTIAFVAALAWMVVV